MHVFPPWDVAIPVRLELGRDILDYLDAPGIKAENKDSPLLGSTVRKTKHCPALP